MSSHTISIPNALYQKAQCVAQQTSQQVEDVLHLWLKAASEQPSIDLPADKRAELQAMAYLSDNTLWTIIHEQMPKAVQARVGADDGE